MSESANEKGPPWLRKLKSNPVVAVLLVIVALVTGFAAFTDALNKIGRFFADDEPRQVSTTALVSPEVLETKPDRDTVLETKPDRDAVLEKAILGKWRSNAKLPTPAGVKVTELYNIFLPGGIYNSRGSYQYFYNEYPIMISGNWEVIDGNLHFEVTSSNVPTAIAVGFKSFTELLSVENGRMTYIDAADGKTNIDYKIN